ncbi:MAG: transposase [Solirubrobacterales bacterium]
MSSQYRRRDYRPYELIHFTVRGHNRRRIFHNQADHDEFLDDVRNRIDLSPPSLRPTLLGYAQMSNHQHVFMRAGSDPSHAPAIMRSVSIAYAKSYNWRYGGQGQIFQQPFRGKTTRTPEHMVNAFTYIHLNPDHSLRTTNSSHAFYAGLKDDPHIDPSLAWQLFGNRDGYLDFFNDTNRIRAARQAAKRRYENG